MGRGEVLHWILHSVTFTSALALFPRPSGLFKQDPEGLCPRSDLGHPACPLTWVYPAAASSLHPQRVPSAGSWSRCPWKHRVPPGWNGTFCSLLSLLPDCVTWLEELGTRLEDPCTDDCPSVTISHWEASLGPLDILLQSCRVLGGAVVNGCDYLHQLIFISAKSLWRPGRWT